MSTNFEDLILRAATGSRPAAGVPGRLFYDTTLEKWQRDTGVDWEDCEPAAGGSDAGDITYTPTTDTDWDSDTDPGNVDDALDQLAERVDDLEGAGGGGAIYPQSATLFATQFVITAGGGALNLATNTAQIYNLLVNPDTMANGDAMQTSVVLKAGTYDVTVIGSTANNKPIVDWSMDGVNFITGQDWYTSGTTYKVLKTGNVTIASDGRHLVKVTINGKNGSSSAYVFTFTCIIFNAQTLSTET